MDKNNIIEKTRAYVKETLNGAEGGHDWFHIERVYNNAKLIAKVEKVDLFIVELGALLHDIADSKFHDGDESIGPKKAASFLEGIEVPTDIIEHIVNIIIHISFKSGLESGGLMANISSEVLPPGNKMENSCSVQRNLKSESPSTSYQPLSRREESP